VIPSRPVCTLLLVTLLHAARLAAADCATCTYAKRGDRWEGVGVRQVSGASFDLLGVEIPAAGKPAAGGDPIRLWFWLPAAETLTIEVWEPRTNYWMVPDARPYAGGLQSYDWPRGAVLAPLGLDLASLRPKVRNRDETLYFPALLAAGPRPQRGEGYAFVFRSGAGIDALATLSSDTGGKLTPVRRLRFSEDLGGILRLTWDGRDEQGRPVPDGVYVLRLKGDMLAETLRPLTFTLSFFHHGRFD
jgi:hypothetical protein